jgi:hypothetical protein
VTRLLLAAVAVIALIALVALPSLLDALEGGDDLSATQAPIVLEPRAGPTTEGNAERRRAQRQSSDD